MFVERDAWVNFMNYYEFPPTIVPVSSHGPIICPRTRASYLSRSMDA